MRPLKRTILTKCLIFDETINANKAIAEQHNFIYKIIYLSMTLPWEHPHTQQFTKEE